MGAYRSSPEMGRRCRLILIAGMAQQEDAGREEVGRTTWPRRG